MSKRSYHELSTTDESLDRLSKRQRPNQPDRLSSLSDELLLRTLSFLPLSDLALCQRLSRRLKSLAGDSQLWKALFYDRFVRPRASRIPGLRDKENGNRSLHYASRVARWLDDDHLVKQGKATEWKRQYKMRDNWSRGRAQVRETQLPGQAPVPTLLLRLHAAVVVGADSARGLRAWSLKGQEGLIATKSLSFDRDDNINRKRAEPTSLAVDESEGEKNVLNLSVGFSDGSFGIYTLRKEERLFVHRYTHAPSSNGTVSAIAFASPYLLTMTLEPKLSLYTFGNGCDEAGFSPLEPPTLISSLKSHTAYWPMSLGLRASSNIIIASVAYAHPTWRTRWSMGLQELRLTPDGKVLDSRMASSYETGRIVDGTSLESFMDASRAKSLPFSKPISLSYSHPYLLTAHADNTLTLFMVTSTADELRIGFGKRLWGHTSSVSVAHVGDRGKAVSVSKAGNEVRLWDLEGGLPVHPFKGRDVLGEASVRVLEKTGQAEDIRLPYLMDRYFHSVPCNVEVSKDWVAFDEEKVVLLREKTQGNQALVVYDFT